MSTGLLKRSEGLSYRVSIIITKFIDHRKSADYMSLIFIVAFSYSFGSILYHLYMVVSFVCFCLYF
jgi:hypothetical protein